MGQLRITLGVRQHRKQGLNMTDQPKIRVQVLHGEPLVDAGLAATLARYPGLQVLEPRPSSVSQPALLHWLTELCVDVVFTDYELGLSLAEAMNRAHVPVGSLSPRLVIVTNRATQGEIREALKRGVRGYLTVTSASQEFVEGARRVHAGFRYFSEQLTRALVDDMLSDQLTARERDVLQLAAQGCANKSIASRLQVEVGTVKCHMRAILEKLHAANRTEAVVKASQRGLLSLGAEASPSMAASALTSANRGSLLVGGASATLLQKAMA